MVKKIILGIVLIALIGLGAYLWRALPIISAYGAKMMCSCVFLSDWSPESVNEGELSVGLLSLGSFSVNEPEAMVTGSVFGLASRTAIFRENLGCTLLNGIKKNELKAQSFNLTTPQQVDQDTIPWPMGNRVYDSLRSGYDLDRLADAVNGAFTDEQYINPSGTRAVVVVKDDVLLYEQYAAGFSPDMPQLGWSMTKSLMNTAIGLLRQHYNYPEIQQPVPFDRWNESEKAAITSNHLRQMSRGLAWTEHYGGPGDATNMLFLKYSAADVAASVGMEAQPGEHWEYSSGTSTILSQLFREYVGD
jgi:hypothetical protein